MINPVHLLGAAVYMFFAAVTWWLRWLWPAAYTFGVARVLLGKA